MIKFQDYCPYFHRIYSAAAASNGDIKFLSVEICFHLIIRSRRDLLPLITAFYRRPARGQTYVGRLRLGVAATRERVIKENGQRRRRRREIKARRARAHEVTTGATAPGVRLNNAI